jgi:hypothetical protein
MMVKSKELENEVEDQKTKTEKNTIRKREKKKVGR